jgi:hypothetical protein
VESVVLVVVEQVEMVLAHLHLELLEHKTLVLAGVVVDIIIPLLFMDLAEVVVQELLLFLIQPNS